ncbi:unnamed protein product [Moneuplotes crassus]|uniref:C2HC/C3H-type domain-containing protein n=1 Tax=Euplotes crassus TaxID=5936 RepID=A0AAD1XK35_EUPCR|nr:unnamed protein product [Moneuplotes crassus]
MGSGNSNLVDENGNKMTKQQIKEYKRQQKEAKKVEKIAQKAHKKAEKQAKKEMKKNLTRAETTKVFVKGNPLSTQDLKKAAIAKEHLGLLKKKINNESTFSSKFPGPSSRTSGNNWATDRSPYGNKSKAVGKNSPNYISDKRKVYGQYNKSPDNRALNNSPIHHKTPRQLAVYPTENLSEAPPTNFKLVPCSKCGRNFSKNNLARHESVCKKKATRNNKVFNSKKQRAALSGDPNDDTATSWKDMQSNRRMNNAMSVAKDFSTVEEPSTLIRYKLCPICNIKQTTGGYNLHYEECNQRRLRMGQRKQRRQLGSRQFLS